ncbi:MAG: aminotransferase class V-fold PLP-dependent enzyme [Thermoleophilaceae bacterium]
MQELRAEFPLLERVAYLNAGTNGPVPACAVEAAKASLARQAASGRAGGEFFDSLLAGHDRLRGHAAALLGCEVGEVALTQSTTAGVNAVLGALELGAGDEVLTSDEEHPGLLAPLAALGRRRGVELRVVPFGELGAAVGPRTRLVACSHVSWVTGQVVDASGLAAAGVPVLLDGAQGMGAVPVDVRKLGCDFYAASGQKWLCGPNGLGYLYVRAERARELVPGSSSYGALEEPARALELPLHDDARRFETGLLAPHDLAWAEAAHELFAGVGWQAVHERGAALADGLARALAEAGLTVAGRGRSTLVSWEVEDPPGAVERLLGEGVVVRALPGRQYVRASVGGWTSEAELERLLSLAAA